MNMDLISKKERRNLTSERKRKLEPTTLEKKKVCVENYSWWTNMMLDMMQGEHSQVSAVTTCSGINNKSLQWDKQWIFAMSLGLCSCVGWVKNV
jgi:hypothetical protein